MSQRETRGVELDAGTHLRDEGTVALDVVDVWKSFGSLTANAAISLRVRKGEVVALLGENGAGKTTLMNILYGHYTPDQGEVYAFGQRLKHGSPHAALEAGIGMVHQHFTLAENLTVLDNIVLGTDPTWAPWLNKRSARRKLWELMTNTGLRVDPEATVATLSVGEAQRVEILKALYRGVGILILDEPTAVLTPQETKDLFQMIDQLVQDGLAVIFISHKLKEVMEVSTRCVVLRSGKVVGDVDTRETSAEYLANLMVGEKVAQAKRVRSEKGNVLLELENLEVEERNRKLVRACNLQVLEGEIVGLAGVSGNGQNALFDVLAGMRSPSAGRVVLDGRVLGDLTPAKAAERGIGRIPEDRHSTGLMLGLALWENMISETYRSSRFQSRQFIKHKAAFAYTSDLVERFDIKCPGPKAITRVLSGGNMQKMLLGRTLSREPRLILANQPTRGLDVGAVSFVHGRLLEAKQRGAGVILISEDLDEILSIADRIVVMAAGRVSEPVFAEDVTVESLGLLMAGEDIGEGQSGKDVAGQPSKDRMELHH